MNNKITNWFFHLNWARKLKEQQNSPFKMKNESEALKSGCIIEIHNAIEPLWLSMKKLVHQLQVKTVQNNRTRIYRDDFGKETILPDPVFSENQLANIVSRYRQYLFIIIGFTVAETFLYYLTASLMVPGSPEYMKIIVAGSIAFFIMFALNYGLSHHFHYRAALESGISTHQLKNYRDTRFIGYVTLLIAIVGIIFAGLGRIFYLEFVPQKGLDAEKYKNVSHASGYISIFTFAVTILAAFLLAAFKQELNKYSNKYKVYTAWHKAHVARNAYTQMLIADANRIRFIIRNSEEKYWQLIIDSKRIFKMETEYDPKNEDLQREYVALRSQPGFAVNDHIYFKFSVLQSAFEELFRYGIYNDAEIREYLRVTDEILRIPEAHMAEHISALSKLLQPKPISPLNGTSKLPQLSTANVKLNNMKQTITILALLCASAFSSCTNLQQPTRVIVPLDLSNSDSGVISWYMHTVATSIIRNMGQKDCIYVLPLDYGSQTASQEIFKVDFSQNDYTNEFAGLQESEAAASVHADSVSAASDRFENACLTAHSQRTSLAKKTDIIGALKQATKYISPTNRCVLPIFSDMLIYTDKDKMNFETGLTDTSQITSYLERMEKVDLKNAQVIVLTGAQPNISPEKFNIVKTLWERYFKSCNAQVVDYTSNATTKLEELIQNK